MVAVSATTATRVVILPENVLKGEMIEVIAVVAGVAAAVDLVAAQMTGSATTAGRLAIFLLTALRVPKAGVVVVEAVVTAARVTSKYGFLNKI